MEKPTLAKHYFSTKQETDLLEQDILRRRYVERYMVARQFVYGVVMDMACGCGYGTYLLNKNPDVTRIYGVDDSQEAIQFANREYASDRMRFICDTIEAVQVESVNTLVSLETIEHLADPCVLNDFAQKHQVENLILSYPSKKTTHYNMNHLWDFKTQDIIDIFSDFVINKEFTFAYDTCLLSLVRHSRGGIRESRWRPKSLRPGR